MPPANAQTCARPPAERPPLRPTGLPAYALAFAALCLVRGGAAQADDAPAVSGAMAGFEQAFKLTLGEYVFSDQSRGQDINLRYSGPVGHLWVGEFRLAEQGIAQWRTGWDQTYGTRLRVSPSIQLASGGFAGGSLQFETGESWFVGAGLGRTNLRPYWNLNFDPNDSYLLAAGRNGDAGQAISVQWVRDNRQNPDQRHLHFVYRQPWPDGERLTADLLYKQGLVEGTMIHRWGFSLTYDWPRYFVRVAMDPRTNFTPVDAWRLALGMRF